MDPADTNTGDYEHQDQPAEDAGLVLIETDQWVGIDGGRTLYDGSA